MSKLDIKQWKVFKIEDLFITEKKGKKVNVPTGASVAQKNLKNGEIPKISVSGINNGIVGYYQSDDKNFRTYKNFISVSFLSTVFYHPYEANLDMKVHCLKPIGKELNIYTGEFLVTVIKKSLKNYSYSDQISSSVLPKIKIKLPVDLNGNVDWFYMEEYMKKIENKVKYSVEKLSSAKYMKRKCDTNNWKRFHLYDIFNIDAGTKLDRIAMKFDNPTINFVGRSGVNNGVTTCVDKIKGYAPYKAGNLTLALGGAYLGSCFVQDKEFYTSQNVIVLIPKYEMTFNTKQFICSMIFKEGQTYYKAFIDELNRHIKTDFSIKLPVDKSGNIDYEYIDNYMDSINKDTISRFEIFADI